MSRWQRLRHEDDGVALVMALVFLFVVSIFVTVALEKSQSVAMSGVALRDRGSLEYALDGGVERAADLLQRDMADTTDPDLCESPSPTPEQLAGVEDGGQLSLNGQAVRFTCRTLAGVAARDSDGHFTDYAIVVTSEAADALTSQGAVNDPLIIDGAVYLSGPVSNSGLSKKITVKDANVVQGPGCIQSQLTAVTQIAVDADRYKSCVLQTALQAQPVISLPDPAPAQTPDLSTIFVDYPIANGNGNGNGNGNNSQADCRIFFPGRYKNPPQLLVGVGKVNWFLGGTYAFHLPDGSPTWSIPQNGTVLAGNPADPAGEAMQIPSDCPSIAELQTVVTAVNPPVTGVATTAAALSQHTATFIFEGRTKLVVVGALRMAAPAPTAASQPPLSIVAARTTDTGYTAWTGPGLLVDNSTGNAELVLNGKLFAPDAGASIFASLPTVATIRAGAVVKTLHLSASAAAQDIAVTTHTTQPSSGDPYRTIELVAEPAVPNGSTAKHTAVVNVWNHAPYPVDVLSWRAD